MATLSAESHCVNVPPHRGRRSLICLPVQKRLLDVSNQVLDHLFSYLLQQVLANDVVIVRRQDHC